MKPAEYRELKAPAGSGRVLRINFGPGAFFWTGDARFGDCGPSFRWEAGVVAVKTHPDDAIRAKVQAVAKALGARVRARE